MKQYWDIKSLHQDKVLLFRMGDFFEMFHDDAVRAAPVIGIALTQRNKKSADETPMCGVPHHSISGPINKLLAAGFKVAICDQLEDPKLAKGIVKRGVTRILTPGMVYDSDNLDGTKQHYIAGLDANSVSFLDTTTGEAFFLKVSTAKSLQLISLLPVVEIVLDPEFKLANLPAHFVVSHWPELKNGLGELPESALRLLSYVSHLSGEESLKNLRNFEERNLEERLHLSPIVLRHLEVFQTYKGEGKGSLFYAINRTQTSAGSRMLRQWLSFPLQNEKQILERQTQVEFWRSHLQELKRVRTVLGQMGDIERRLSKISLPTANGRDLLALAGSVQAGLSALDVIQRRADWTALEELAETIERTMVPEPPLSTKQGYLIQKGVSPELDELIELSTNAQGLVTQMEENEKSLTGISSLKIRYNNVFGYYIEITNTHKDRAPSRYQRKQTLTNAERYCTDELIELERKVLSAQSKRADLEYEYFENLKNEILGNAPQLLEFARCLSELDVFSALAWLSLEENYVRPKFVSAGLNLVGSRHPVVEQSVSHFIANDLSLSPSGCLLLTGPNMAGKSTLMRQVALTAIMAQVGSYVPAREATLSIFDAIYTRIGASDQLSEGLSTFMVEMTETAAMLQTATRQSLLILDEVGRGTSTFDGMSLAQSILEYILSDLKALTLFATHYHELTSLAESFGQIKNAHMSIAEKNGDIQFLHSLKPGPALKSYGVQVAELAGVPLQITKRAKSLLKELEKKRLDASSQLNLLDENFEAPQVQTEVLPENYQQLLQFAQKMKDLEISKMTPLEAMISLASLQENIKNESLI